MSRLLTLGVLNQGFDLAKKLTDEYVAYLTLIGGVVNYNRVYNIYKDEYLTDPERENMVQWWDARAGKTPQSGYPDTFRGMVSLIYPYHLKEVTGNYNSRWQLTEDNAIVKSSSVTPILYCNNNYLNNGKTLNIKNVVLINYKPQDAGASNVPLFYINGKNSSNVTGIFTYIRYLYAQPRLGSYLNNYDDSTNNATTYPTRDINIDNVVLTQSIDYVNRMHRNEYLDVFQQVPIGAGRVPKVFDNTTTNTLAIYPAMEVKYHKQYLF